MRRITPPIESAPKNPRGGLVVPAGATVHYGEPSIVYGVTIKGKEPVRMYSKPPEHPKSEYEKEKNENVTPGITEDRPLIVRKTKKGETETLLANYQCKDGEEVLVRPFEYQDPNNPNKKIKHPYLLQVATYEQMGKPEAGRQDVGHEIKIKKLGYMFADDLHCIETFTPVNGDIFPHRPRASDIAQGRMGDCYFLAALNAILSQPNGEQMIMDMMKQQQPDGTTTIVRLYNPATGQPEFIRVENSYHSTQAGMVVYHRAPWVHILEKAYAGLGFKENIKNDEKYQAKVVAKNQQGSNQQTYVIVPQALQGVTGSGGKPDLAFNILTGMEAKIVRINYDITNFNPFYTSEMHTISGILLPLLYFDRRIQSKEAKLAEEKKRKSAGESIPSEDEIKTPEILNNFKSRLKNALNQHPIFNEQWPIKTLETSALYKAMAGDKSLIQDWIIYIKLMEKYYPDDLKNLIPRQTLQNREEMIQVLARLENAKTTNHPILPPEGVLVKFREFLSPHELDNKNRSVYNAPGRVGSGEYTAREYEMFEKLSIHASRHVLAASTPAAFSDGKVDGLANNHAYTITRVYKRINKITGKENLYVTLRNPWGTTGRVYDFANDDDYRQKGKSSCAVMDPGRPEFDLDITEFMKFFSDYSYGTIPNPEKILNENKGLEQELAEKASFIARPFAQVETSMKDEYIQTLLASTPRALIHALEKQSLYDLHDLAQYIQKAIQEKTQAISAREHGSLTRQFEADKELLKTMLNDVEKAFNHKIVEGGHLDIVRQNASKYLNLNLSPKRDTHSMFGLRRDKEDYLELFTSHRHYEAEQAKKQILLEGFAGLKNSDQKVFIEQLLKQPESIINKVFASQSRDDLKSLKSECQQQQLQLLINKINAIEVNSLSDVRNHDCSKYGYDGHGGRGLEILAQAYLASHKDEILPLLPKEISLTETAINNSNCIVTRVSENKYELLVQTHDQTHTFQVEENILLRFAAAQRVADNKQSLRSTLFPGANKDESSRSTLRAG